MIDIDFYTYKGPCIYSIQNIDNNKIYIGKTINYRDRARKHKQALSRKGHHNKYLQRSFNKGNRFIISPLEYCNSEQLLNAEIKWISFFNSKNSDKGYNLCDGGNGPVGYKATPEARRKISERMKKWWTPEKVKSWVDNKKGKPSPLKGRKMSEEAKEAMRISKTGKKYIITDKWKAAAIKRGELRRGKYLGRKVPITVTHIPSGNKQLFDTSLLAEVFLGMKKDNMKNKFYKYNGMINGRPSYIKCNSFIYNDYKIER